MTPGDTARVLAACAACDGRPISTEVVSVWHQILHNVDFADAMAAVTRHYAADTMRIMPADIRYLATEAKRQRLQAERRNLALPSRYEETGQADRNAACAARNEARRIAAEAAQRAAEARDEIERRSRNALGVLDAALAVLATTARED